MTSLLEKIISIIAPNHCIVCSKENNVLCESCLWSVFGEPLDMCYVCGKPTLDSQVCLACRASTPLKHVWIGGTYEGVRRELIRKYKFERLYSAHSVLVDALDATVPYLADDIVVVPVPTASTRARARGYGHVELIAKGMARKRGLQYAAALRRRHDRRQVGASRPQRSAQAQSAYEIVDAGLVSGKRILLVDDVTTSGATLSATARLCKQAGALEVNAVVVAKATKLETV